MLWRHNCSCIVTIAWVNVNRKVVHLRVVLPMMYLGTQELIVTAYPNPADLFFTINVQGNLSAPVDITVSDMKGRKLLSTKSAAKGSI